MHQKKEKQVEIDRDLLRKYIAYAKRKIDPEITDEAFEEIKNFYIKMRGLQKEGGGISISARQLQGLVRLSEAHAKMRLSTAVEKEDALAAIRLTEYYLRQVGYDEETNTFDIDRFTTRVSSSQRNKIILLRETIKKLEDKHGVQVPLDILQQTIGDDITEIEFEEGLEKLRKSGDIFHPKQGFVQLTTSRK